MAKPKNKAMKKQTAAPAPQPAPLPAPTDAQSAPQTVRDANALLAIATDPSVTVPGWKDRRTLAVCEVCGEQHQNPLSYLGRIAKRGVASQDELDWLARHLQAAGVQLPASA